MVAGFRPRSLSCVQEFAQEDTSIDHAREQTYREESVYQYR